MFVRVFDGYKAFWLATSQIATVTEPDSSGRPSKTIVRTVTGEDYELFFPHDVGDIINPVVASFMAQPDTFMLKLIEITDGEEYEVERYPVLGWSRRADGSIEPELNDCSLRELDPTMLYPGGSIEIAGGAFYPSDGTTSSHEEALSSWTKDELKARKRRREREEIQKRESSRAELV